MESQTGGVKPFPIEGRVARERERLLGMSDQERAWRKQWLKDQHLAHNEPRIVPEYYKELMNPIRRAYRFPLDAAFGALEPVLGNNTAQYARYFTGKILLGLLGFYSITYYFKYNTSDWTTRKGWKVVTSRKAVLPGDPEFPKTSERSAPSDYASRGFKNSPI